MRPHVYRTHDGGATWTRVVDGLPEMGPVNVVREDPKQPGLLFAGTERAVYVSADDGAALAAAAAEHAGVVGPGPRDPRGRPRGRHARAVDLDPGQHRAAARTRAGGRGRSARICTGRLGRRACGGTCSRTRRCRPKSRPARTRPTARRSTTTCRGRLARWPSRSSTPTAACVRRFSSRDTEEAIDAGGAPLPHLLVPAAAAARCRRGTPSVRVGPALSAAAGRGAVVLDRRDLPEHAERAGRAVRAPGTLSRAAHRGWRRVGAPYRRAHGPARVNRGGGRAGARRTCRWPAIAAISARRPCATPSTARLREAGPGGARRGDAAGASRARACRATPT